LGFRAIHLFKTQSYRISCKITHFQSVVVSFPNNQEVGRADMDWIDLAQDMGQVAGACEAGNEH